MSAKKAETPFDRWYSRNKKKHNARRRRAYIVDAGYRLRTQEAARDWRHRNRDRLAAKPKVSPWHTISVAAEMLGTCPQTLRSLEKRGLVPKRIGKGYRKYTPHQVTLLIDLVNYLLSHHYREEDYDKAVKKLSVVVHKNWNKG